MDPIYRKVIIAPFMIFRDVISITDSGGGL